VSRGLSVAVKSNTKTHTSFYGGPLRGIFGKLRKQNILGNVQTMILDGLSVPSDLVSEIILQDSYNVKVLSIRDVKHLNEGKLQQALKYAVRASRPEGTPKLQALYLFGPRDPKPSTLKLRLRDEYEVDSSSSGIIGSIVHAQGAQIGAMINIKLESTTHSASLARVDKWYRGTGKVLTKSIPAGWEATLMDCEGIICFDAVLCRGPRHSHATVAPGVTQVRHAESLPPRAANISVRGCHSCGTSPEGFAIFGKSSSWHLPLLAPAPLHASTQKASISPFLDLPKGFLARCTDCMRARFCESCYKWWCEDCYTLPDVAANTRTLLATSDTETDDVKVHMGLCVDTCLAPSMMAGAGSNGLWG